MFLLDCRSYSDPRIHPREPSPVMAFPCPILWQPSSLACGRSSKDYWDQNVFLTWVNDHSAKLTWSFEASSILCPSDISWPNSRAALGYLYLFESPITLSGLMFDGPNETASRALQMSLLGWSSSWHWLQLISSNMSRLQVNKTVTYSINPRTFNFTANFKHSARVTHLRSSSRSHLLAISSMGISLGSATSAIRLE